MGLVFLVSCGNLFLSNYFLINLGFYNFDYSITFTCILVKNFAANFKSAFDFDGNEVFSLFTWCYRENDRIPIFILVSRKPEFSNF